MLEEYPTQIQDIITIIVATNANIEEQVIIQEELHRTIYERIKMACKLLLLSNRRAMK